jgi:hypothetical protein
MQNFIFGDTGGHAIQLFNALKSLGVDVKNYIIPEDVRIIHLGDLIHKGPSSKLLLETVDQLIRNNPGQWVQILGNHEFQHIEGSPYFWNCECDFDDEAIINDWYDEGLAFATFGLEKYESIKLGPFLNLKARVKAPVSGILFSHASLSWSWWKKFNSLTSAVELSKELNELHAMDITAAGQMLGVHNGKPGPVWAIGNSEVFNDWKKHPKDVMPFMQIHGHTSSYKWSQNEWWDKSRSFKAFTEATELNKESRAVITQLNDNLLIGIDPGYTKYASGKVQPYMSLLT